jgi:hypothetical protein
VEHVVDRTGDIARDISWLPACEHRGEGVFLQFNEEALRNWQSRPEVCARAMMLFEVFNAPNFIENGSLATAANPKASTLGKQ